MSMGRIRSPGLINQRAPGRRRPLLLALLALLVVLLTEQIIEYYEQRVAVEAEQVSTLGYLSTVRARLEGVINSNLLLIHGLTAVIAANPDIDQAGFAHIASGLVGKDSALRNIAGAPGMVISLMYPLTGNESAMGLDYRTHPTQRAAAIHAMESGHAVVAGPLPLVQGGTGIIVREPVFVPSDVPGSNARPWGLVSSVIDADVLYRKAGLDTLNPSIRVAIRGRDGTGAKGPVFFGDPQVFNDQPVTQNVTLPGGGIWQVAASPVAGWGRETHALWGIRLAGLLIALAAALAIYQIFRSRMALTQTNARLNTLLDTIPDLVWVKDPNGVYLACNPRFEAFFGASEADIVGKTDYDFVPADNADFFRAKDRAAIEASVPSINEEWLTFVSDGHRELAETIKTPMYDSKGEVVGVLGIARDITGRKHAEEGVRNLNRVYAVLSGINEAIVRLREPEQLFTEACRIAVEVGGFRMAWLGMADKEGGEVRPQAHAGEVGGYLDHLHISLADNEHGLGPTGRALREGLHVVCNDIASDPRMAPWRDEALALGYRASAAFPLRVAGELRGTFNLYADSDGFFNETELQLLDELASDIGFALEFMETDAARENLSMRMVDLLESMSDGFVSLDREWHYQYVNRRGGEILGRDSSSLVGAHIWTEFPNALGETFRQACEKAMHERVPSRVEVYSAPRSKWYENHIYPTHEGVSIFFSDITERKRIQAEMELNAKVFEQGSEGIIICDAERNMVSVNRSLCETTGYSTQELLGKNPRIFKSGRHGIDFYRNIWIHVEQQGYWQGEIWNRRKNGDIYPEWLSISTVKDATGKITNYIGMASDITQHKEAEEHIRHLAHFDALTGLPNRTMLNDRIEYAISLAQRSRHPMALMFLDLDRFKNVNDSLGHQVGDQMLIEVAKRLKADVREEDTVSRLGGDEFILLLPDTNADGAAHVAGKIIRTMAAPFMIAGHELSITPSIGIAMYPVDGQNMESLLQCADSAMYRAKQSGYNTYQFFAAEMHLHATRTLRLENALRRALERKELVLHYQPQLDIETGKIIGCEALLRWNHAEFGIISPADFIPIAEDSGQILSIGEWVLRTAVQQNRAWQQAGLPPLVIAVNISAVQFREIHLVQLISQILREYRLAPEHLELELTERITMKDPAAAIGIMERLHREGIKLSIDDFGTGYSSLSYLKRFRINKLKIDQSFVRDITSDPEDEAIVDAVISLAKSLNLRTIAEGVETVEQLEFLRNKGCDEIQGYYLSRPLPAKEFEAFLRANQGK
jgi:diguanylate cyclase (GGDEF)-like protein/PAS domain S-box-containing protein